MNTHELIVQLAIRLQMPQRKVHLGLKSLINCLRRAFAENRGFTIRNFGTFFIQGRGNRRDFVTTGEQRMFPTVRRVLRFRAARALKNAVREKP